MKTLFLSLFLLFITPKDTTEVLTVKIAYDDVRYVEGMYFRLYKLSNDSFGLFPIAANVKVGDTINFK